MAKRDPSIEVLRLLLMFGICLLHSVSKGICNCQWLDKLLSPCVCGFVFVSGWFGVKFSIRKVVRLYGIGIYAACVCAVVPIVQTGQVDIRGYLELVAKLWKHFWFLHAYVVMMCFSPMVNLVVERTRRNQALVVLAPVMAFTYIWSWGASFPCVGRLFPSAIGLGAYSGFALLSTYIVARLCRLHFPDIRNGRLLVLGTVALVMVLLSGGDYHSPFAVMLAAAGFYGFKAMSSYIPKWLSFVALSLSPSLFSVYLLHSHGLVGFPIILGLEKVLSRYLSFGGVYIVTATIVFLSCIALDSPRRLVIYLFDKLSNTKTSDAS